MQTQTSTKTYTKHSAYICTPGWRVVRLGHCFVRRLFSSSPLIALWAALFSSFWRWHCDATSVYLMQRLSVIFAWPLFLSFRPKTVLKETLGVSASPGGVAIVSLCHDIVFPFLVLQSNQASYFSRYCCLSSAISRHTVAALPYIFFAISQPSFCDHRPRGRLAYDWGKKVFPQTHMSYLARAVLTFGKGRLDILLLSCKTANSGGYTLPEWEINRIIWQIKKETIQKRRPCCVRSVGSGKRGEKKVKPRNERSNQHRSLGVSNLETSHQLSSFLGYSLYLSLLFRCNMKTWQLQLKI